MEEIMDILENTYRIPDNDGPDKVIPLKEAIRKYVRPEMTICIGSMHNWPTAPTYEIIRQYWEKKPNFTIIIAGMMTPNILLVYSDLVKKVCADLYADVYYTPAPNPVIQKAMQEKKIEFEQWSVLTHPLALMAGAMGVGFMPTKSLLGSSFEKENAHSFKSINDPFDEERKIGLVKAVNPDICIIHGLAADRAGNIIFVPPYGEDVFGAFASKEGVIVTVEKIVSTEFVRKYSHMVRIPGHIVKSVSEVPFGSHPYGIGNIQIPELPAYDDDYEFMYELRTTFRDPEKIKAWVNEWVLSCPSHREYVKKLGGKKVVYLKGKTQKDALHYELESEINEDMESGKFSDLEMAIVAASRKIRKAVVERGYKVMVAGLGLGSLAAWLAYYTLKDDHYEELDLAVEMGLYGYAPRPGDPFTFNHTNYHVCKMLTNKWTMLGLVIAGFSQQTIGILGAAQIDKLGNINSNFIAPDLFMTGTGGANDIASGASEVMVVMRQLTKKLNFVDKVDYISCPGSRVRMVVSPLGIFEKANEGNELILTGYMESNVTDTVKNAVDAIKENCGWDLQVFSELEGIAPPTSKELIILRLLDPKRYWLRK